MNMTWSRLLVGTVVGVCLLGIGALEVLSERVRVDPDFPTASQLGGVRMDPSWDAIGVPSEPTGPEADLAPGVEEPALPVPRDMADSAQRAGLTVLEIDEKARRLVSVNAAGRVVIGEVDDQAVVVTDDRKDADLALLRPGDVIRVEPRGGPVQRIVVLRHGWDEVTSPQQ